MGNTHRHRCYYECSIKRSLQPHTNQTTTTLQLRDPQALTAVTGENIDIYGIKEMTLVHDN
eukprot:882839-Amphidinium_carterae.1